MNFCMVVVEYFNKRGYGYYYFVLLISFCVTVDAVCLTLWLFICTILHYILRVASGLSQTSEDLENGKSEDKVTWSLEKKFYIVKDVVFSVLVVAVTIFLLQTTWSGTFRWKVFHGP